jgi:hypothetical protein
VRIRLQLSARRMQDVSRHPEVNQENTLTLEPNNQILAAPIDGCDTLAHELGRHLDRVLGPRQPRVVDLDVVEAPADEHRLESTADRLDLGQLGHASSVATSVQESG